MPGQPSATTILAEIASMAAANASDEKLQYWRTELGRLISTAQPPLPKLMQNGLQRCEEHLRGEQQRREFLREAEARKQQVSRLVDAALICGEFPWNAKTRKPQ